jgi:2,3-bisphosphoglycerate-dependent phosphoglycerate mutase
VTDDRYHQRLYAPPPGATELLLVRHGASAPAVPGSPFPLRDGHSDPPLAPEGAEQARALCARLSAQPLVAVFISPLQRTRQTVEPLGVEPVVLDDLREVHTGEFEGVFRIKAADGDPLIARVWSEGRWDVIPGAEPMEEFAARVRSAVDAVVAAAGPDCSAAVITHGGVIAELCHQATGSHRFAFLTVDNASISRLVVHADGTWLLHGYNDTSHLVEQPALHPARDGDHLPGDVAGGER